ncbi:MAG: PD-(D/E)XK nuclease family protein [Elusimicrobiota bacterium]
MSGTLKVFHGPFEALEDALAARVAELRPKEGDAPLLIVAPSRAMAERLERLLSVEKGLPLLGVHFHTFHSLAAAIVEEGGFPDGVLISDPLFHDAVVDQVLDEAPSLGIAKELRPKALAAAVRSSLRDLVDAGVDPALLAENFGDELLREDADERARFIALLSLLAVYEKKLAKLGVLPPSALVRRAALLAPESKWLGRFREVFYYGFYDLTGLQADAFEAVTSSRPSRLYFPYRKGHPAFRFADAFFDVKLAGREPVDVSRPGGPGTALGPALDALFDPAGLPSKVDSEMIRVVSASGARDEAWASAKEAYRLIEDGVPCGEIAVIARQLEPYRAALTEAFAAEGLPLDLSAGEPILRHPLAKAALDLLTLRRRDFPARAVEDLAASPYFESADPGRVALWRKLIAALGVRAGWLQWRGKLEPRARGPVELYPHRVREGLAGFAVPAADVAALWDFLAGVRDGLGGPAAPWSKRVEEARALLAAHLGFPKDPSPAEADARRAVADALTELEAFDRLGAAASWEDFLDAFEAKLTRATRSVGAGEGGVRALDAMDARGHRFRATIVMGLKEKLFPRQIQEDPILREGARAALRHPAGYWIGRKAAGHEEERLLFYLTVASARERLTLIYPRSDENGRADVPSTYLRELCRAAGLPAPGEDDAWRVPRPPAERLRATPAARRTPAEAVLLCALEGGDPPAALDAGGALAEGFRLAAALNARGGPGPHDGQVPPPAAALAAWRKSGLSPTALDEYAKCPFKFFASRVLGLSDREEGTERGELSSAARGQVYHGVLERFYRTLPEAVWVGRGDAPGHLNAVLAEAFAENDWRVLGLYPLLWEAARLEMSAHLHAFVAWDLARLRAGSFRPRLFEAKLKGEPEGGAPAGIPWRGIVDRVDADEAGVRFRVVDYKTRKSASWSKNLSRKIAEGESHQIPFYAVLAAGALGNGWEFAGGELLFLEADEDAHASGLTSEDWAKAREPFLRTLAVKVEAIGRGRFPIRPMDGEGGHCSWCDFPTLCRKSHGPSRARAAVAA